MGPPLPPQPLGHTKGTGGSELAVYLDYTCPFSTKAYKTIFHELQPKVDGRVRCVFHHQVQPWHPQSTLLHEAALAVNRVAGPEAFWKYSDALFDNATSFYDVNVLDKTRPQIYEELTKLAAAAVPGLDAEAVRKLLSLQTEGNPGELNVGVGVTQELKWAVKHSRQEGIHVSPTTTLNGLVCDTSSSWTLEQWLEFLDTQLPPASSPPEKADTAVLKALVSPLIIDARDPNEVEGCKGGEALPGCVHVPMNIDGAKQSERATTTGEFYDKLKSAGALPADKGAPIITHCGSGGRGGKAAAILRELGYYNAHNGGSPDNIRAARM